MTAQSQAFLRQAAKEIRQTQHAVWALSEDVLALSVRLGEWARDLDEEANAQGEVGELMQDADELAPRRRRRA